MYTYIQGVAPSRSLCRAPSFCCLATAAARRTEASATRAFMCLAASERCWSWWAESAAPTRARTDTACASADTLAVLRLTMRRQR